MFGENVEETSKLFITVTWIAPLNNNGASVDNYKVFMREFGNSAAIFKEVG